jgi:amidohydrolase
VIGTPAEEGGGGKIIELEAGLFDGLDAALMFHPGTNNWSWAPLTAQAELEITVHGRAAHPTGNPTEGVDAFAALVQVFNTLTALRQRLPTGAHVQGIITRGGTATNIVPGLAEGRFGLRSLTTSGLHDLIGQVSELAGYTGHATGTRVDVRLLRTPYAHFRRNDVLSAVFDGHMEPLGVVMTEPQPGVYLGSSDIGNISAAVPAIHPFVAITGADRSDHTPHFATAAASPAGRAAMLRPHKPSPTPRSTSLLALTSLTRRGQSSDAATPE